MIIWQTEEFYKTNFANKIEVIREANDLIGNCVVLCAICRGKLKYHGCYRRHVQDAESNKEYGWVAQARCDNCKVYPALIPEFIMPYKHYSAEVIEHVITKSENGGSVECLGGVSADASTMRRWCRQFKERGQQAVGWLISILLDLYERQISLLKLQNKTLLKQFALLLNEFPIPERDGVLGRVNIILTMRNCGFM